MKTSKIVGVFVLVGLIVGCSTVGDLTGGMIGDFVTGDRTEDKDASGSDDGESEARSSDDGDVTDEAESPYDDMTGSLGMLPPATAFQIVYAQTSFFTAGYAPASDYEPGEGVRWVLTWRDADGEEVDVTWWRVPEVPGDTVRFEFVPVTDEDERYLGELQEFRDDYRSRL